MKITISDPRPMTATELQTAYQNGYNQYPIDHPVLPFNGILELFNFSNTVTFKIRALKDDSSGFIDYVLSPRQSILIKYEDLNGNYLYIPACDTPGTYRYYLSFFNNTDGVVSTNHGGTQVNLTGSFDNGMQMLYSPNIHYQYVSLMMA